MADPRPSALSFRPPARVARDADFDETIFDRVAAGNQTDDGDLDEPEPEDEDAPPSREGLPPGFRMRADAHYVEEIATRRYGEPVHLLPVGEIDGPYPADAGALQPLVRSIARFGVLQPLLVRRRGKRHELIAGARRLAAAMAAGLTEVPCLVYFADDDKACELTEATNLASRPTPAPSAVPAEAFAELTEQLGAITACLHLFRPGERPTRERVAMGLIRAEVQRAVWLAQGLAVLSAPPRLAVGRVELLPLVERVVAGMAPERLLTGVPIQVEGAESWIEGDEPLLSIAVAGLVTALHAAAEQAENTRLRVSVVPGESGQPTVVEVGVDGGRWPVDARAALLDTSLSGRPGGIRAAVGVEAATRIAALHGGRVSLTGGDAFGVLLELPS